MSWMPFLLQGLISSIGDADEGDSEPSVDNRLIEERNEIEREKLKQEEIANRIRALSRYSDDELLEKLEKLEPTITYDSTLAVYGGPWNKALLEDDLGEQIEDNPDYVRIKEELESRGVNF